MAKVFVIAKNTVPLSNPAGLIAYRYAKTFSDLGHETKIYSFEDNINEQHIPEWLYQDDGVSVIRIVTKKNKKIKKYLLSLYQLIKDIYVELSQKNDVYLLTHTNPLYCHWFGFFCKLIFGSKIKWIASFTDPYISSPFDNYSKLTFGAVLRRCEQMLTFGLADKLIFVTNKMRDYICSNNKASFKKSKVIPFYYLDSWKERIYLQLFNGVEVAKEKNIIHIMHAGSIYGNRDISLFIQVVNNHSDLIRFENFGSIKNYSIEPLSNIKIHNALPYGDMLSNLMGCDFILVVDSFFKDIENPYMPSKIVDAMYLNKPIFGITQPGSELDCFLKATGNISVPNDIKCIEEALVKLISASPQRHDYHQYSSHLVGTLLQNIFK